MTKQLAVCCVACLTLFLVSCGYHFSGNQDLPGGSTRIYVGMFENRSSEQGVESVFTRAVIQELARSTSAVIVKREKADAVVTGRIKSISITTLTRSSDDTAVERSVSAVVDLALTAKSGDVLWSISDYQENEEYTVSQVHATDAAAERQGIEKIAVRIAERLVSSMTDAF